jgi:hypothetical protein
MKISLILFLSLALVSNSICQTYSLVPGLNNEYGYNNPSNMRVFDAFEDINALVQDGELTISPDSTSATLVAHFTEIQDSLSNWTLELILSNGMDWEDWYSQGVPTSYIDNSVTVTDEYEEWLYYIISCGQLIGSGNREGSQLNLVHAPSNNYYGFQFGFNSNGWSSGFGALVWATAEGTITDVNENLEVETSPQFSFYFDIENNTSESIINICDEFSAGTNILTADLCGNSINLEGSMPCNENGEWTLISGSGTLSSSNDPNAVFSTTEGTHELEWSYACQDSTYTDTITIDLVNIDVIEDFGGPDITIDYCDTDSTSFLGVEPFPGGTLYWNLEEGCPVDIYETTDPTATVTGLIPGEYQFSANYYNTEFGCELFYVNEVNITVEPCGEEIVEDCEILISGCTLEFATNYNPEATIDNQTCLFDFTVCDCSDNVHSPYVFLELGDGIANNTASLNFNCPLWGYDCGDLGIDSADYEDFCQGGLSPLYGCTDNIIENTPTLWNIFPNPSTGDFSISLNSELGKIKIEILNSLGQAIHQEILESSLQQINPRTTLPPGIYLIRLIQEDQTLEKTLVVQK